MYLVLLIMKIWTEARGTTLTFLLVLACPKDAQICLWGELRWLTELQRSLNPCTRHASWLGSHLILGTEIPRHAH